MPAGGAEPVPASSGTFTPCWRRHWISLIRPASEASPSALEEPPVLRDVDDVERDAALGRERGDAAPGLPGSAGDENGLDVRVVGHASYRTATR